MYMMMYDYAHNLKVEDRGDSSSFAYLWTHQFSPSGLSSNQNCSKPFQHLVKLEIVEYDWIILVTVAPCSQHVVGWQQMRFETTFVRLQLGMEAMDTWTSSHARWSRTRWQLESWPGCPSVNRLSVVLPLFVNFFGRIKVPHHKKGRKMMAFESRQLTFY